MSTQNPQSMIKKLVPTWKFLKQTSPEKWEIMNEICWVHITVVVCHNFREFASDEWIESINSCVTRYGTGPVGLLKNFWGEVTLQLWIEFCWICQYAPSEGSKYMLAWCAYLAFLLCCRHECWQITAFSSNLNQPFETASQVTSNSFFRKCWITLKWGTSSHIKICNSNQFTIPFSVVRSPWPPVLASFLWWEFVRPFF